MKWIELVVYGEPVPIAKMNFNQKKGRIFFRDPNGSKRGWMEEIKRRAIEKLGDDDGFEKGVPLTIWMEFYLTKPDKCKRDHPTVKPDLDNLAYGVTNVLKGVLYHDDNQIVHQSIGKQYVDDPNKARVYINIKILEEPLGA